VPWVSLIHNGHAAFGTLDAERALRAYRDRLCQICGHELDERCFLIVRPADQARGYSPEPALHPECLPYSAAHCPMLNGTATHYRRHPVLAGHPADTPGVPAGISLTVPIRRKRLLREAALPENTAHLLELLRSALDLEGDG
jgi:hypothetical protein